MGYSNALRIEFLPNEEVPAKSCYKVIIPRWALGKKVILNEKTEDLQGWREEGEIIKHFGALTDLILQLGQIKRSK